MLRYCRCNSRLGSVNCFYQRLRSIGARTIKSKIKRTYSYHVIRSSPKPLSHEIGKRFVLRTDVEN